MNQRKLLITAIVLVAATWWAATSPDSPIHPTPPKPDRPVLRFLGKLATVAAKIGLTAMLFCEPAPAEADEVPLAHAVLGPDGHQQLRNERW